MRKKILYSTVTGAMLGVILAEKGYDLSSFEFWIFAILGTIFLNYLYSICKDDKE